MLSNICIFSFLSCLVCVSTTCCCLCWIITFYCPHSGGPRKERHGHPVSFSDSQQLPESALQDVHSAGQLGEGAEAVRLPPWPRLQPADQENHHRGQHHHRHCEYRPDSLCNAVVVMCLHWEVGLLCVKELRQMVLLCDWRIKMENVVNCSCCATFSLLSCWYYGWLSLHRKENVMQMEAHLLF